MSRYYEFNNETYPSVTTVLKMISANEDLMRWANAMGFKRKDIKKIQDESAHFGTLVHSHIQSLVDPSITPIPFNDPLEEYSVNNIIQEFTKYFSDTKYETIFSEKSLVSSTLGYGGTLDWYVRFDNEIDALIDFKTSKKPHNTYYLQLGAYYNLLMEQGIHPTFGGVLIINERTCCLYPVEDKYLESYGKIFNLLFQFYKEWDEFKPAIDFKIASMIHGTFGQNNGVNR